MNNRNTLCSCGSGKKAKLCCLKTMQIVEQKRIADRNKEKLSHVASEIKFVDVQKAMMG